MTLRPRLSVEHSASVGRRGADTGGGADTALETGLTASVYQLVTTHPTPPHRNCMIHKRPDLSLPQTGSLGYNKETRQFGEILHNFILHHSCYSGCYNIHNIHLDFRLLPKKKILRNKSETTCILEK